jgi:hypothetical protein
LDMPYINITWTEKLPKQIYLWMSRRNGTTYSITLSATKGSPAIL